MNLDSCSSPAFNFNSAPVSFDHPLWPSPIGPVPTDYPSPLPSPYSLDFALTPFPYNIDNSIWSPTPLSKFDFTDDSFSLKRKRPEEANEIENNILTKKAKNTENTENELIGLLSPFIRNSLNLDFNLANELPQNVTFSSSALSFSDVNIEDPPRESSLTTFVIENILPPLYTEAYSASNHNSSTSIFLSNVTACDNDQDDDEEIFLNPETVLPPVSDAKRVPSNPLLEPDQAASPPLYTLFSPSFIANNTIPLTPQPRIISSVHEIHNDSSLMDENTQLHHLNSPSLVLQNSSPHNPVEAFDCNTDSVRIVTDLTKACDDVGENILTGDNNDISEPVQITGYAGPGTVPKGETSIHPIIIN